MIIDSAALRWYDKTIRSIRLKLDRQRRHRRDSIFSPSSSNRQALKSILFAHRQKMGKAARARPKKPTKWIYPWATERHYAAAIRAWLRPMEEYVHQYLKNNQEAILRGDSASLVRQDATPGGSYRRMVKSLEGWEATYIPEQGSGETPKIYMGLGQIAESMNDFNSKQWEKAAKAELGVEFPVYENWWPETKKFWADENYKLIQSMAKNYITQVNIKAEQAVTGGWAPAQLAKEIHKIDQSLKASKVNLIARDQIGKLNGQVSQARMESVGLDLYIWSTSDDERVRDSHAELEGMLCRWDDSTVYSEDGGKTWKDRPSGWCQLHPGEDIQCRCTALSYWNELVNEVDHQIDLLSENVNNIPDTVYEGLAVMKTPEKKTTNEALINQAEARETKRRKENAKKAKESADKFFPNEKWKTVEDGIYLSPRRAIGQKTNYEDEKRDAQILQEYGATVYLTPESSREGGRKYDAIVNGLKMEFKNMSGSSVRTLEDHFYTSREQAPNVFLNLENSPLSRREIMSTLYRARNSDDYAKHSQNNTGGRIILKIKDMDHLIYLNVDDLEIKR